MIKLIIFSLLGKKLPYGGSLFNVIKTYLIVYLLILPAFMDAQEFEWAKSRPLDFQLNPDMTNFQDRTNDAGSVYRAGLSDFKGIYNASDNITKKQISVCHLNEGLYFIRFHFTDGPVKTRKFVKD